MFDPKLQSITQKQSHQTSIKAQPVMRQLTLSPEFVAVYLEKRREESTKSAGNLICEIIPNVSELAPAIFDEFIKQKPEEQSEADAICTCYSVLKGTSQEEFSS